MRLSLASPGLTLLRLALGCAATQWTERIPEAVGGDPERIATDVAWLADDARDGRGLGTQGLAEAAAYPADGYERAGFEPGGADGSFCQPFEMPVGIRLADARPAGDGSPLAGPRGAGFLARAYELLNARSRGAAAVLIAPSAATLEALPAGAGAELPNPTLASAGIPSLAVSRSAAEDIVADAAEALAVKPRARELGA